MSTIHLFGNNNYPITNFGDLEKTLIVNKLMETEFSQRNEEWVGEFLKNIGEAKLQLGDPEIIMDPDGFPYMHLKTVSTGESFKAFVLKNEIPLLLEKTFGVIINPTNSKPDWIFSSGDILNYYLNEAFYTDETIFSKNVNAITIQKDEDILVGAPSEEILPTFVRRSIKEHLQHAGIKNPKSCSLRAITPMKRPCRKI